MTKTANHPSAPPLRLPARYILTDVGITYCRQRSIPLHEIVTEDLRKGSGFVWPQVNVDFVQKLVTYGLLKEIELRRNDLTSKRLELLRLMREMCYGMLHRRYRAALKSSLRRVEEVKTLLEHPSIAIDSKGSKQVNPALIKATVTKHKEAIAELRARLRERAGELLAQAVASWKRRSVFSKSLSPQSTKRAGSFFSSSITAVTKTPSPPKF
jgi:hypothetical protein